MKLIQRAGGRRAAGDEGRFPKAGTMTDAAAAKLYGVHRVTIYKYRKRHGIAKAPLATPTPDAILDALEEKPSTLAEIERATGLSQNQVHSALYRLERSGHVKRAGRGSKKVIRGYGDLGGMGSIRWQIVWADEDDE